MCMHREIVFNPLPATPKYFAEDKFKAGDEIQINMYKDNKKPNQKKKLTYEYILSEKCNYARQVPMNCCFIDYDSKTEFEIMKRIIVRAGLNCLILETQHGGQFLFKKPNFYSKEMTGATNWFGYKFDSKASWVDKTGKEIRPFIGHRAQVTNISSVSDNLFCTCSQDNAIKIWDIREPRAVATFYAGGATPTSITSSSNYIVAGYSDAKLRTFDIRHKQAKAALGVDMNRQLASTISFNEKLDALSMFSTAQADDTGYWKNSPDLNNRFAVLSPFIRN